MKEKNMGWVERNGEENALKRIEKLSTTFGRPRKRNCFLE